MPYIHNNKNTLPNYVEVTVNSNSKLNDDNGEPSSEELADYLKATKNCQVNDAKIQSLAKQLTAGLTTDLAKAAAIFNYVRDKINYKFYYNSIEGGNGALGVLNRKWGIVLIKLIY